MYQKKHVTNFDHKPAIIERAYFTKPLLMFGAPLIVLALFLAALTYAFNSEDRANCHKWAKEAEAYPLFYLTQTQAQQCAYWHIEVNAPVK